MEPKEVGVLCAFLTVQRKRPLASSTSFLSTIGILNLGYVSFKKLDSKSGSFCTLLAYNCSKFASVLACTQITGVRRCSSQYPQGSSVISVTSVASCKAKGLSSGLAIVVD